MKFFEEIDWNTMWSVTKDTILPDSGTLISNIIILTCIGFILSIVYIIILSKKKVLRRTPKYYNLLVKLYIPILIVTFLYIFGHIGFLRGVYKVLDKEKEPVITALYTSTLSTIFKSEESKNSFIKKLQASANLTKIGSDYFIAELKEKSLNYTSGVSLIDESKNKIANYLIEEYGNDIYKTSLYGLLTAAGAKTGMDIKESLSYDEFSDAMNFLLNVGYKDIEKAIKERLFVWYNYLLESQYNSMTKSLLFLLILVMSLPVIEFFIYNKWIKPDRLNK